MNYMIKKYLYSIFDLDTTTSIDTEASTVVSVHWSLDAVTPDSSNTYNRILMNSASYFSTANNQTFVAYGQELRLSSSSSSSQYMKTHGLFSTTVYSGDYGIFGQCPCTTYSNQCLYFLVRGSHLFADYFNGYIDNVQITIRAKTSDEILTTASLAGYFSFDVRSPYKGNGPNSFNGTQNNTIIASGYVN
ncbi:unnamed protein product [Rotaria sp. Silwood1]|nr:unnamed protein product [Rotaria sp. Silwood1]CAF1452553.1 unnamed protein product [Rotaria sp. Silwood1]CAF3580906.1 unnamed protein product [Rotaria sp. Silwood1]